MSLKTLLAILALIISLSGCAELVVGGAATGMQMVHDRRTSGTIIEDQAIELKAYVRLREAGLNQNAHINVTSYNTVVLLSGEVPSQAHAQRAEAVVRQVEKVRQVVNELAVAGASSLASRTSDAWITTKAKSSLLRIDGLPDFDPTRVKVVTERGIVYLFGLLTPREAEAVTSTVRRVGGVQKVVRLFEYIDRPT